MLYIKKRMKILFKFLIKIVHKIKIYNALKISLKEISINTCSLRIVIQYPPKVSTSIIQQTKMFHIKYYIISSLFIRYYLFYLVKRFRIFLDVSLQQISSLRMILSSSFLATITAQSNVLKIKLHL